MHEQDNTTDKDRQDIMRVHTRTHSCSITWVYFVSLRWPANHRCTDAFRENNAEKERDISGTRSQCLEVKKVLHHCFGGHRLDAPSRILKLPEGLAFVSQINNRPPFFYKISHDVYIPGIIGAHDAVLGKLGWATCGDLSKNSFSRSSTSSYLLHLP